MNETYENLKQLLNKLEYSKYGRHIYGDLKVVWWVSDWDKRSIVVFYVKGTAEQRLCITRRETGLKGNLW
jgi:hypothetical protein